MTIYFHDTEQIVGYEQVCEWYYSNHIPHQKEITAMDSSNGEILFRGKLKNLMRK